MKEKIMEKAVELLKEKKMGKTISLKTKGKSMYPLIKDNSEIEVRIVSENKLEKGDIIFYYRKKNFFAHRLLKKKNGNFLIKGDNNWGFDSIIKEKEIIGKVEKINGRKTDSISFKLIKMPVIIYSYFTGMILEQKWKK